MPSALTQTSFVWRIAYLQVIILAVEQKAKIHKYSHWNPFEIYCLHPECTEFINKELHFMPQCAKDIASDAVI